VDPQHFVTFVFIDFQILCFVCWSHQSPGDAHFTPGSQTQIAPRAKWRLWSNL